MSRKHKWEVGMTFPTRKGGTVTIISFEEGSYTHCLMRCSICHKDKELFPEPLRCNKYKLKNGQQCCACGKTYYWTEEQYVIKVKRQCDNLDYTFNGWSSSYRGIDTRCDLLCDKGHKYTPSIDGFLSSRYRGCMGCRNGLLSDKFRRTDKQVDTILKEHLGDDHDFVKWVATDGYTNSDSLFTYYCKNGDRYYDKTFNGISGCRPNCCYGGGFKSSKSGYFYLSFWESGEGDGFYKYGITNKNPKYRLDNQQRKSHKHKGKLKNVIWFEKGGDCIILEDEMKALYGHLVTEKPLFMDGYTETILGDIGIFQELAGDIAILTGLSIYTNQEHKPFEHHTNSIFEGDYYMINVEDLS